jgi:hypothetical protein
MVWMERVGVACRFLFFDVTGGARGSVAERPHLVAHIGEKSGLAPVSRLSEIAGGQQSLVRCCTSCSNRVLTRGADHVFLFSRNELQFKKEPEDGFQRSIAQ